jgi:hypothetical protein
MSIPIGNLKYPYRTIKFGGGGGRRGKFEV